MMTNQPDMSRTVDEDYHKCNPIIETSVIHNFTTYCHRMLKLRYPWMAAITGYAGVGKTAAIDHYVSSAPRNVVNGRKHILKVVSSDDSTRKTIAHDLAEQMGINISGNFTKTIREDLQREMRANLIKLILVDESDQSRKDVFELFRMLRDNAGVRVVFVGLPNLKNKIKKHPQIESRVRTADPDQLYMETISLIESLDFLYPKINMDRFNYDPSNAVHRTLGKRIFDVTHGNFRDVVALLDSASDFARDYGDNEITIKHINDAIVVDHNFSNAKNDNGENTHFETTSKQRQKGK